MSVLCGTARTSSGYVTHHSRGGGAREHTPGVLRSECLGVCVCVLSLVLQVKKQFKENMKEAEALAKRRLKELQEQLRLERQNARTDLRDTIFRLMEACQDPDMSEGFTAFLKSASPLHPPPSLTLTLTPTLTLTLILTLTLTPTPASPQTQSVTTSARPSPTTRCLRRSRRSRSGSWSSSRWAPRSVCRRCTMRQGRGLSPLMHAASRSKSISCSSSCHSTLRYTALGGVLLLLLLLAASHRNCIAYMYAFCASPRVAAAPRQGEADAA